jgi:hypothetical protein
VARSPSLSRSVASAIRSAKNDPKDAAARALAQRYAALIDEAAPAAKYRKALDRLAPAVAFYADEDADQVVDAFNTVRTALAEHSVASDLGPKLLAALHALGLTLAARGATKEASGGKPADSAEDEIARQRARRATRKDRAAAVDAAAAPADT